MSISARWAGCNKRNAPFLKPGGLHFLALPFLLAKNNVTVAEVGVVLKQVWWQQRLFDSDREFGFASGVFGGIGGPLEPEAGMERCRARIAEGKSGAGSGEKLEFPFLIGSNVHLNQRASGCVDFILNTAVGYQFFTAEAQR